MTMEQLPRIPGLPHTQLSLLYTPCCAPLRTDRGCLERQCCFPAGGTLEIDLPTFKDRAVTAILTTTEKLGKLEINAWSWSLLGVNNLKIWYKSFIVGRVSSLHLCSWLFCVCQGKSTETRKKNSYTQILHPSCSRAMYDLGHTIMSPSLYLKKQTK